MLKLSVSDNRTPLKLTLNLFKNSLALSLQPAKVLSSSPYEGEYTVIPKARQSQSLPTKGKFLSKDINVLEIPYFDVSNESGTTIFIASEVN